MRPYMRSPKFKDAVQAGQIQFGGAVPSSPDDYTEKLDQLMAQGEAEAREALKDFYASNFKHTHFCLTEDLYEQCCEAAMQIKENQ